MTSKTELKELIVSLKEDIRELRMEVEVLKTLIGNNNYVYPFVSNPQITYKTNGIDYQFPGGTSISNSDSFKESSTSDVTKYPEGTIITYL